MIASCARRSLAAATMRMALVICCVFSTLVMRRRMSLRVATWGSSPSSRLALLRSRRLAGLEDLAPTGRTGGQKAPEKRVEQPPGEVPRPRPRKQSTVDSIFGPGGTEPVTPPGEYSGWLDDVPISAESKSKVAGFTWRKLSEGSMGGIRWKSLEWLADNARSKKTRERAGRCLSCIRARAAIDAADDPNWDKDVPEIPLEDYER